MNTHHFDRMPKSLRSHAIELHENIAEIEAWRATLTEKQQRRLIGPQQNVRRWLHETAPNNVRGADDVKKAKRAWRYFLSCTKSLAPEHAAPIWQMALAEVACRS